MSPVSYKVLANALFLFLIVTASVNAECHQKCKLLCLEIGGGDECLRDCGCSAFNGTSKGSTMARRENGEKRMKTEGYNGEAGKKKELIEHGKQLLVGESIPGISKEGAIDVKRGTGIERDMGSASGTGINSLAQKLEEARIRAKKAHNEFVDAKLEKQEADKQLHDLKKNIIMEISSLEDPIIESHTTAPISNGKNTKLSEVGTGVFNPKTADPLESNYPIPNNSANPSISNTTCSDQCDMRFDLIKYNDCLKSCNLLYSTRSITSFYRKRDYEKDNNIFLLVIFLISVIAILGVFVCWVKQKRAPPSKRRLMNPSSEKEAADNYHRLN